MSKDPKKTCHFVLTEALSKAIDEMAGQDRVDENEKPDRSKVMRSLIRKERDRREEARKARAGHVARGAKS